MILISVLSGTVIPLLCSQTCDPTVAPARKTSVATLFEPLALVFDELMN